MKEDSAHSPVGDTECGMFEEASVTDGQGLTFHEGRSQPGRTAPPIGRGDLRHPPEADLPMCELCSQGEHQCELIQVPGACDIL